MIIAVFSRILRPGVEVAELVDAWRPDGDEQYPAGVEVGVDPADDRRVVTIIRFDGDMSQFSQAMPRLVHPDSLQRLESLVESTELQVVYETVDIQL